MPYKILCPTDETEASRKAEKVAVDLANALGDKLTFAHVEANTPLGPIVGWDATLVDEARAEKHEVLTHSLKADRERLSGRVRDPQKLQNCVSDHTLCKQRRL